MFDVKKKNGSVKESTIFDEKNKIDIFCDILSCSHFVFDDKNPSIYAIT